MRETAARVCRGVTWSKPGAVALHWRRRWAEVQADGKIVFGGWVDDATGTPAGLLGRLNVFGVLDSSFGTAGFAVSPTMQPALAGPIEILKDGSIVVGGAARPSSPPT